MTGFTRGFGYAFAGLGALRRSGLKRFVMIPLAVNTVVFGAAGYYSFGQLGRFTDWLAARPDPAAPIVGLRAWEDGLRQLPRGVEIRPVSSFIRAASISR